MHLKRQIESVHEGNKPFKCNTCNVNFAGKQNLNVHIASLHEWKKDFKCKICDVNFAKEQNLK